MRILFIFLLTIFIFGCSRKKDSESSLIQIHAGGVGSMAALPGGRKACYGVSVTGSGIPTSAANSCNPEIGITAGFAEDGQVLQALVPKGTGRKIDVYLYLNDSGDTGPCPTMGNSFSINQMDQVYFLGSVSNVELTKETETVSISTTFPGESQNLAIQNSYGAGCLPATSKANYKVSSGVGLSTGGAYKLHGRFGSAVGGTTLTGGSFKLKVK